MARRPNRKLRKSERIKQKNFRGLVIGGIALVAIAGLVAFSLTQDTVTVDKETFCPKDQDNSPGITAVVLDTTDRLTPIQQEALVNEFQRLQDGLGKYERLELYEVGSTKEQPLKSLFSLCNPGRGKDIDPLIGNPRLVEKKWQESFTKPLKEVLASTMNRSSAQSSPIIESLQSVAVTSIDRFNGSGGRRLIIASDMLQHSDLYSHYSAAETFEVFKESPQYKRAFARLGRTEVSIWYVRRSGMENRQNRAHITFWEKYLKDQGATLQSVKTLG
jgi:hypothetical protein